MASNSASPGDATGRQYGRLKALQRQPSPLQPSNELQYVKDPVQGPYDLPLGTTSSAERLKELLGAIVKRNAYGEHLSLHCWHGEHAPCTPTESALELLLPNAPDEVRDPDSWLFLDTETTGLCGGTGTYPFLIGLAWWDTGGLEVEQLFMRDLNEERSVLTALAERVQDRPVLVTFNGRSFDWPLIETRFRMTRRLLAPIPKAHLDFLHPSRNIWKLRLGSVRLSQLERHVLGWDRGEDMDSGDIPRIYLDFLRGGPAEPLVSVILHNQLDLRGLAGLAGHVLTLLGDESAGSADGLDLFGLSRICERRGQIKRARKMYERSVSSALPRETDLAARAALARLAKRDRDFGSACELWAGMLGNSREGYKAYEQLAVYHEHTARDLPKAIEFTRDALTQLRRAYHLELIAPKPYHSSKAAFERRLKRLEQKLERAKEKGGQQNGLEVDVLF